MFRISASLIIASLAQCYCIAETPTFDAISVKMLAPTAPKKLVLSGGPGSPDPGRFRAELNMSALLQAAFGLSLDQIRGPSWLRDFSAMPFYEIIATMPADTTKGQFEKMLENALVEKFKLVFHRETKDFPGYQLVLDKSGLKIAEDVNAEADPDPANAPQPKSARMGSDGFPVLPGARTFGWRASTTHQRIKFQALSMAAFASHLGFLIGSSQGKSATDGFLQPRIADRTGLHGRYTFILEYDCAACEALDARPTPPDNPDGNNDSVSTRREEGGFDSIFVAVQQQLGLKLEKTASIPMMVLVVEGLEKTPVN